MKQTQMNIVFTLMKISLLLIVLTSILAAVLIHTDLNGLKIFNSIFQIIP